MARTKGDKLSDEQFLSVLRENAGLFARTARAITAQFKVPYTRQSVRERAGNFPEQVIDIAEQNIDIAEEGIHTLMSSENEAIKFKACELILKTLGKKRGYIERQEIDFPQHEVIEVRLKKKVDVKKGS